MVFIFVIFLALLNNIDGKYQSTDSCPSGIVQWKRREAIFDCPTKKPYHCILLYNTSELYEACIAAVTIGPAQVGCPWIHFYNGRPIHGSKNSECPVTNPDCPPRDHKGYLSNQLYLYQACFLYRSARLSQISTTFTTRNLSTTVKIGTNSSIASDNPTDQPFQSWIVVVIAFIVLAAVVLALMIILRRKLKGMCTSNDGSSQDIEEERNQFIGFKKSNTPEEKREHSRSSTSPKDETSFSDRNSTNNQHEEVFDEELVQSVFRSILNISDGIVSYQQLLIHFEQKEDCSNFVDNLEYILKGNRKLFRLLEGKSICFVIAYIPDAEICEQYNQQSEARKCVSLSCTKFHVCSSYVKGLCSKQECTLSHTYGDKHNMKVKDRLRLSSYSDIDLNKILLNCYPKICSTTGCKKEKGCPFLHICSKFCFGKCEDGDRCRFNHSFVTEHNTWILKAYGNLNYETWSGSNKAKKLTIAQ